jgi:ABC-type uncharacterized transport system substrate-binding protein
MATGAPAIADITITDIQVAARTLSFLDEPMTGRVRIGIVYSLQSPRSRSQADSLYATLAGGLTVGAVVLQPVLLAIDDASHADVDLFLLTEHIPPSGNELAAVSAARQIPCVTTDIEQVRNGNCIIAVRSRPKVEIIVNRKAAIDSGARFATAFRVMVTEI